MSSYLFGWLVFLGLALGGMANLMLLNLTGGRWGEAVRPAFRACARVVPLAGLFGLPLLTGMRELYPIDERAWFGAGFFAARTVGYFVVWSALALLVLRRPSIGVSAVGLIVYGFTMSIAAVDWIAALVPTWYSTGFGLVVGTGQMLGAMALAVAYLGLRSGSVPEPKDQPKEVFHDLGNLLLMFVLTWAYLAFMQFLIIWVGNLPREIEWYVPRLQTGWVALAIVLAAFHFFAPLAILLFRSVKRAPLLLGSVAAALLVLHVVDVYWLVAPSIRPHGFSIAWGDPVALIAAAGLWAFAWRPRHA